MIKKSDANRCAHESLLQHHSSDFSGGGHVGWNFIAHYFLGWGNVYVPLWAYDYSRFQFCNLLARGWFENTRHLNLEPTPVETGSQHFLSTINAGSVRSTTPESLSGFPNPGEAWVEIGNEALIQGFHVSLVLTLGHCTKMNICGNWMVPLTKIENRKCGRGFLEGELENIWK